MRRWPVGVMLLVASFGMNEARAKTDKPMPGSPPGKPMPGGGGAVVRPMGGGMTGCLGISGLGGSIGTMSGMPTGMIGMSGCCGGMMGMPCGGCLGSFTGCTPGICNFTGCGGGFSSCMPGAFCGQLTGFPGCCGGMIQPQFQQTVSQFYTAWTRTPGKSYYHRSLFVYFPGFVDKHHELLLIHYPDRRGELYFYDPAQRQYLAKYHVERQDGELFFAGACQGSAGLSEGDSEHRVRQARCDADAAAAWHHPSGRAGELDGPRGSAAAAAVGVAGRRRASAAGSARGKEVISTGQKTRRAAIRLNRGSIVSPNVARRSAS